MGKRCFCGCGRRVGFGARWANSVGARVSLALEILENLAESLERWQVLRPSYVEDGEHWRARLQEIAHGQRDRRDIDRAGVLEWLQEGWDLRWKVAAAKRRHLRHVGDGAPRWGTTSPRTAAGGPRGHGQRTG
jgi:hypothetical protein